MGTGSDTKLLGDKNLSVIMYNLYLFFSNKKKTENNHGQYTTFNNMTALRVNIGSNKNDNCAEQNNVGILIV